MHRWLAVFCFGFISLMLLLAPAQAQAPVPPIPCSAKGGYARNIWTMTVFDSRLYVGCGNASNVGPNPNSGKITVFSSSDGGLTFTGEFVADEDQISRFSVINGQLVVPGMDAHETDSAGAQLPSASEWLLGNYYTLGLGHWTKVRNIPDGVHVFDMTYLGSVSTGKVLAGLGARTYKALASSTDGGLTWAEEPIPYGSADFSTYTQPPTCSGSSSFAATRAYLFYNVAGLEMVNTSPEFQQYCDLWGYYELASFTNAYLAPDGHFYPTDTFPRLPFPRVVRAASLGTKTAIINGKVDNDQQYIPYFIYTLSLDSGGTIHALDSTPALCTRPQDLTVEGNTLYALCNQQINATTWTVSLQATCDLATWTTLSVLSEPTFARSFASDHHGHFYMALGGDTTAAPVVQAVIGQVLPLPSPASTC